MKEVESHEGGRNLIFLCENEGKYRFAIRISLTGDRHQNAYIAVPVKPDVHLRLKSANECIKPQNYSVNENPIN